jgi:hypothetical protein
MNRMNREVQRYVCLFSFSKTYLHYPEMRRGKVLLIKLKSEIQLINIKREYILREELKLDYTYSSN